MATSKYPTGKWIKSSSNRFFSNREFLTHSVEVNSSASSLGKVASDQNNQSEKNTQPAYLLRTVSTEDCFRFYSAVGKFTGETACSTVDFAAKLQTIPIDSVTFHFLHQDFQKWFRDTIGDEKLADRIDQIKAGLQGEDLRNELLKKVQNRTAELNMTPEDLRVAWRVAAYTIIVFAVITYFFVGVWPSKTEDIALNATTRQVTLYGTGVRFPIGAETTLVFVMMFAGIMGACVFSLFAISHHLGADKDFDKTWQAWYLLRPIIGGGLALIFYFLLRGGVLSIGANLNSLNLVGLAAVSGLVGMFAEHAMHKLQDLADTLFGAAPENAQTTASTTPPASANANS